MKISEFAKKSGVTVKTLLHYDKIGLLKPSMKSENGYRIYYDEDFIRLQQISTLKFVGLSLQEIKQVLDHKEENIEQLIDIEMKVLEEKKNKIETVINGLQKSKKEIETNNYLDINKFIDIIRLTTMEDKAKERFNNASSKYVTGSYIWRDRTAKLINELVKPNSKDIILDIGCGTGNQLIELSKKIKLAIGIDISEGMIKQAKENVKREGKNNIEFFIGTFLEPNLNIALGEKHVTKIISNYALHHLAMEYKEKAIEKMIDLNEDVKQIIIGDLMFFEDPEKYKSEFSLVGYGPEVDFPSTVKEIKECFEKFYFITEIHKLHPLVGVIVAKRV